MNTKFLMGSSAIFLVLIGLCCSFLPNELLKYLGAGETNSLSVFVQVFGSIYFGFGLLNWMAKANLIGGIYSKPVAVGNFAHFLMSSLALAKYFAAHTELTMLLIPLLIYVIFAFCFGKITFGSPL